MYNFYPGNDLKNNDHSKLTVVFQSYKEEKFHSLVNLEGKEKL